MEPSTKPRRLVIAGPNGAGKTTFSRKFLPQTGIAWYVNADAIASGLSPTKPEHAAIAAGRLMLAELDRLATERVDFALESTLGGLTLANRLRRWKAAGYHIEIVFLKLASSEQAVRRVAKRVKQGGHHVPKADIRRRFARGWENFRSVYRPICDAWLVYDQSTASPAVLEQGPLKTPTQPSSPESRRFFQAAQRAMRQATLQAHEDARRWGTTLSLMVDGKLVEVEPMPAKAKKPRKPKK